jgi:hypothetical protein
MAQTAPSLLILAIPQAITFLFLLVASVYVLSKRTERRTAKTYVVASLAIMLTTKVGLLVSNTVMASMVAANSYVFAYVIISTIVSLLYALAIGLLIAAAFTLSSRLERQEDSITGRVTVGNDNPYAPPTP